VVLDYSVARELVPARHLSAMLRNASFRIPELGSGRVALAQARRAAYAASLGLL